MSHGNRVHRGLAILAGALGALAVAAGEPYTGGAGMSGQAAVAIGVLEVARRVRDGNPLVRVVDLRTENQFSAYHIPGAERIAPGELRRRAWRRDEAVVIYAGDDRRAQEASLLLRSLGVERVYVLRGGLVTWIDSIVEPRVAALPETATSEEHAARRDHLELSRYFGGLPVVSPSPLRTMPRPAAPLPSPRSEPAAVARMLRRGC